MTNLVEINIQNNQPVTTSLIIAEVFEKRHADVLRDIESTIRKIPQEFNERNFALGSYKDANNQDRPMYYLAEEAFMLVVMAYTTDKAMTAKLQFISAFKAMREALSKPPALQGDLADMLLLAGQQLKDANNRINLLELTTKKLEPKAEAFEQFLETKTAVAFSKFIKAIQVQHTTYGLLGRNLLYRYLRSKGIICQNNTEPYQDYVNRGFFTLKFIEIGNGRTETQTLITPSGVEWLYQYLKKDPEIVIKKWWGDDNYPLFLGA